MVGGLIPQPDGDAGGHDLHAGLWVKTEWSSNGEVYVGNTMQQPFLISMNKCAQSSSAGLDKVVCSVSFTQNYMFRRAKLKNGSMQQWRRAEDNGVCLCLYIHTNWADTSMFGTIFGQ